MAKAAFPTDFIVKAEKTYGIIDPNNKLVKIIGLSNDTSDEAKLG